MARILYLGSSNTSSNSFLRANTLKRIGHTVDVHDPFKLLAGESRLLKAIHYRTGYRFLQNKMLAWIKSVTGTAAKPDLVWIESGELLGIKSLEALKKLHCPVVLYNVDDPTGKRDGNRFKALLKAVPLYDLIVVVRNETAAELRLLGAKKVVRIFRSYDEVAHQPYPQLADVPDRFRSEVAFIGTWMRGEKRDEFLLELIKDQVPVSIWGNQWEKSPFWQTLQPYYRGKALSGRDYVAAIQGAKICLGLLSKGNRDLHTQRSLEVPYIGGLFCAERTTEHLEMYEEGKEAVFWSDAAECAIVCKALLANDEKRESIRLAGMQKVRSLHMGQETKLKTIIDSVL